tara:strand:- start:326 stop:631 length:306 start_codon:yes stop_codon:yes gene_type:complete
MTTKTQTLNRKQRREKERLLRKSKGEKAEVDEKLGLFDKLPEQCLTCFKPFDKKNKEMVMSWSVVVREKEGVVRLYCPDCWKKANDYMKALEIVSEYYRKP